jgi:hypothetical protein
MMLKLKIKDKGLVIHLPGMAPFRTPAEVNISNLPINTLVHKLRAENINEYEIISTIGKQKVVYRKGELEKKKEKIKESLNNEQTESLNKRFNRLENLILKAINLSSSDRSDSGVDLEQIKNKLDHLERLVEEKEYIYRSSVSEDDNEPEVDDDLYIPDVDLNGMKIKSSNQKTVTEDSDVDESADLLSEITKKSK